MNRARNGLARTGSRATPGLQTLVCPARPATRQHDQALAGGRILVFAVGRAADGCRCRRGRAVAEDRSGERPGSAAAGQPAKIDTTVAHPARVYDYWLGGTENFAADRAAGDEAIAAFPGILAAVRANRAFLARAVRHMAAAGVRQFLDIGPASRRPAIRTRWRGGPPRTPGSSTWTATQSWRCTR